MAIITSTPKGHLGLQKYVETDGIPPLVKICQKIRDNKQVTSGQATHDLDTYQSDLKIFTNLVKALQNLPITAKVLTVTGTRIGKGVNSIVKDGIFKQDPIN